MSALISFDTCTVHSPARKHWQARW